MATPREIWEAAIARHQAADIEGYVAMFAPDGIIELPVNVPGIPARLAGREEILRTLGPLWRAVRDSGRRVLRYDLTAVHTTTDANAAIIEFDAVGEHPGGETYQLSYVHVVHVRDGQIALLRDYVDTRRIAERLAAIAPART